jgi:hypothetical protein
LRGPGGREAGWLLGNQEGSADFIKGNEAEDFLKQANLNRLHLGANLCHVIPWRLPKGSINLRIHRKAAIFLIFGEILLHFSPTFMRQFQSHTTTPEGWPLLMGAPSFVIGG